MHDAATQILIGATLLLVCLAGCRQPHGVYGVATGGSSWTEGVSDGTPGIDAASVTVITMQSGPPEGVPFVVWSDLPNGGDAHGSGQFRSASYKGSHHASDGRKVAFHAETTDGTSGVITIEGVRYDLALGALFLVSSRTDPVTVVQLSVDVRDFPQGKDELMALAKSDQVIREFFEE